ncbi:MAG: hypothetical protein U0165_02605 [Polyangiaceae bacterium]
MFGTFELETEAPIYGLTKNIKTFNPVKVELGEFVEIARDFFAAKGLKAKWQQVFGRTGTIPAVRPAES